MINLFDYLYYLLLNNRHRDLLLLRALRFFFRIFYNIVLKYYFLTTQNDKRFKLNNSSNVNNNIIVSITTFPSRINKTWLVIESLLRQNYKPDKIILWLAKSQFKDATQLPKKLISQQPRGLEIRFVNDDLRSHKKYFYSFLEFKDAIIITIDDDVFYNTNIIKSLLDTFFMFPNCVCCNHCKEIKIIKNIIQPYENWSIYDIPHSPDYKIIPIGVGGILYPPKILDKNTTDIKAITKYCFHADDIWLNMMSKMNYIKAVKTPLKSSYLPIIFKNNITLTSQNVNKGLNDIQLKDVRLFCKNKLGKDPIISTLLKNPMKNDENLPFN